MPLGGKGSIKLKGKNTKSEDLGFIDQMRSPMVASTSHDVMTGLPSPLDSNKFSVLRVGNAVEEATNIILPSEDELTAVMVHNASPEVPKKRGRKRGKANV